MAELEVIYKGSKIIETDLSGTKTLTTQGKYCEDDIEIKYTRPTFQNSFIVITSKNGALLTCGNQTYQLGSNENKHSFLVEPGTYIVTATFDTATASDTVLVDISGVYEIELNPARLPVAFQEVEYIQGTGTQYINTRYIPNSNSKFEYEFKFNDLSGGSVGGTGVPNVGQASLFIPLVTGGDSFRFNMSTDSLLYANANLLYNTVIFNDESNQVIFNNTILGVLSSQNYQNSQTLYLFTSSNPNGTGAFGKLNLKYFKIYDDGDLVRFFVPCYRKFDSKPGLYDLVEDLLYTNSGTGEFFLGGNV